MGGLLPQMDLTDLGKRFKSNETQKGGTRLAQSWGTLRIPENDVQI